MTVHPSSAPPMYTARPPPGLRRKLWDISTKFEVTFALSMMQPWEKAVILSTFAVFAFLCYLSLSFLPTNIYYISRRCAYYVYGDEEVPIWGAVRDWVAGHVWKGIEAGKGVAGAAGGRIVEL